METTKTCTRCGVEKALAFFADDPRYAGGKVTWCRECHSEYRKEHEADPEVAARRKAHHEKWYAERMAAATTRPLPSPNSKKVCTRCGVEKTLADFNVSSVKTDGRQSECRECRKQIQVEYHSRPEVKAREAAYHKARNSTPEGKVQVRRHHYERQYGDPDVYARLIAEQGGVCAICGRPPKKFLLDVDHDHTTGKVRGLLCHSCNMVLGHMNDESRLLRKAADYVDAHAGLPQ